MPRKCSPGLPCPQVVEASIGEEFSHLMPPCQHLEVSECAPTVVLAKYLLLHTGLPIKLHHAGRPRHRWLFRALKGSGLTQSNVSGKDIQDEETRKKNIMVSKEIRFLFPWVIIIIQKKKNWKKNILIDNQRKKEKKKAAIFRKPSLKWSSTCVNLWNHPLKASVPCLVFLGGQKNENIDKNSICTLRLSNICKNV